jgi:putative spermidine/putrescine transport system permease protein
MAATKVPAVEPRTSQGLRVPTPTSLLILPTLVVVGFFLILPYLNMLYISIMTASNQGAFERKLTFENYSRNLADPFIWQVIGLTVQLGLLTVLISLLISYPAAYHLSRQPPRRRGLLMMLIITPLLIGVVIRTYGWMIILSDTGLINQALSALHLPTAELMYNATGVLIGLVHIYVPYMVLALLGPLQAIDPDLESAARSLGASRWNAFWRITWPLSLPGVLSGSILVFVLAISAYIIPQLLGGFVTITMPILVVQQVTDLLNWPEGSALTVIFFVVAVVILAAYTRLMAFFMRGLA